MAYDKTEPIKTTTPQQSFGAPQMPDLIARMTRSAGRWTGGIVGGVLILAVGHAFLPPPVDPVHLIGATLGAIYSAESDAQRRAAAETARQMAEAQAAANARAQMEIVAFQHQQQAIMDAEQGKIAMANAADVTCTLGPVGVALFYGQNSYEARNAMQLVQAACAFAAKARQEIAAEQAEIARLNSAIMERRSASALAGVH